MKMSDVRVGMKLACDKYRPFTPITVTEVNDEGFVYSTEAPIPYRHGEMFAKDGHIHFGYNGWTDYEPVVEILPPESAAEKFAWELVNWVNDTLPSWRDNDPYYALLAKAKELFEKYHEQC